MPYKYKISVIVMFKNEEMIMEEWFQHYISEGIDHFYLIDNGSTDNYIDIVNRYIDKITLVVDPTRDNVATQPLLYNKHFLETIKTESEWIIVADMDEYIYGRRNFNSISDYVNAIPEKITRIIMPWKNFGNNNNRLQPSSIIHSLTKREEGSHLIQRNLSGNWLGHCKSLTRTNSLLRLDVHICETVDRFVCFSDFKKADGLANFSLEDQNLHINHYQHMSNEYYTKVKIIRGRGQTSTPNHYNLEKFHRESKYFNQTDDFELSNKKKALFEICSKQFSSND